MQRKSLEERTDAEIDLRFAQNATRRFCGGSGGGATGVEGEGWGVASGTSIAAFVVVGGHTMAASMG